MNRRTLMVLLAAFLLGLAIWVALITAVLLASYMAGTQAGEMQP